MNSIPPTPGRKRHDSQPTGSLKPVVGIAALTAAVVTGVALLLYLTGYPSTKAKTDSAPSLQNSDANSVRNEKTLARNASRNDTEAIAARSKSSDSGNPPGRVL